MRDTPKIVLVIIAVFLALVIRLGQLQLFRGDELRRLSEYNRLRIAMVPAPRGIIFDRNGHPLVENKPYFSITLRPELLRPEDVGPIAGLLNVPGDEVMSRAGGRRTVQGVRLKEGLTFAEVAYIEARLSDYPALNVEVDVTRNYILNDIAAHVIGYLGKPTPGQMKSEEMAGVPPNAFIGQWGVEKVFDATLRGVPGEKVIEVDAMGRELRLVAENPPVRGKDLHLTLDLNTQVEAETAFGNKTGALVALVPGTGEVLALVSRPSFDPNLFANGIDPEEWLRLQGGDFPMLNRALQSQYPPGSVFKIVTGIAALESGAMTTDTAVTCSGGLFLGSHRFGCWKKEGHGTLSFHNALVQSCDVYFYTAGRKAGINSIAEVARELGAGSVSGLTLVREKAGFIPDEKWKKEKKKEPWYPGETCIASIGQGYVLLTPMQAARLISAVSVGGFLYEPTLTMPDSAPAPVSKLKASAETIEAVREALRGVVNEPGGTAHSSMSKLTVISGKTGTAQVASLKRGKASGKFGDHAWFVAFAPFDKPEIAVAAFMEHGGHGGSVSAPIAKKAIEAYLVKNTEIK